MLRTQLYLPEDLRREIDVVAKREKKPAAQVIRELIKTGMSARQQESVGQAFAKLAGVRAKGPTDLSTNLDAYLYKK
jgi:metal-responsive CopG/Arc/MetJ family transcriptional regulator